MKQLVLVVATVLMSLTLNAQMKIAHVNSQSLLDSLDSYKKAKIDLLKGQDSAYNSINEYQKSIEEAYTKLNNEKNNLNPKALEIQQNTIMDMEQRAQQEQMYWQQRLQDREQEYLQPILDRLQKAVEIVADRKKVNYVLDISKVLYSKTGIDITAEVKVELAKLDAEAMKK